MGEIRAEINCFRLKLLIDIVCFVRVAVRGGGGGRTAYRGTEVGGFLLKTIFVLVGAMKGGRMATGEAIPEVKPERDPIQSSVKHGLLTKHIIER